MWRITVKNKLLYLITTKIASLYEKILKRDAIYNTDGEFYFY